MKLVIQREKWGHGYLLRSDGRMCCLGHMAKNMGASDSLLSGSRLCGNLEKFAYRHFKNGYIGGDIQQIAIEINDDVGMVIKEKEERLKILFKAHGIKLSFKGKVTKEEFERSCK